MKLGKRPPRLDPKRLRLARYLLPANLPDVVPPNADWTTAIANWPMLQNDQLGDCVPAAILHNIQTLTANSHTEHKPTDAEVIQAYHIIGGYNPSDLSTDQGCDMLTALNTWKSTGVAGHKIGAFATIARDLDDLHLAVHLFGGVLLGIMLPRSAENQFDHNEPWDDLGETPDPMRGHCIYVPKYDAQFTYCVTWGKLIPMTAKFLSRYADEAYTALAIDDWGSNPPNAIDLPTLQKDLAAISA